MQLGDKRECLEEDVSWLSRMKGLIQIYMTSTVVSQRAPTGEAPYKSTKEEGGHSFDHLTTQVPMSCLQCP